MYCQTDVRMAYREKLLSPCIILLCIPEKKSEWQVNKNSTIKSYCGLQIKLNLEADAKRKTNNETYCRIVKIEEILFLLPFTLRIFCF